MPAPIRPGMSMTLLRRPAAASAVNNTVPPGASIAPALETRLVTFWPLGSSGTLVTAELAGASQDNGAISTFGADHAAFLRSISGGLRRQVYIVVRGADGAQLDARCEEILTLLVPFGIRASRLGKEETVGLLARATGGGVPGSGQAAPGETVRGGVADAISP